MKHIKLFENFAGSRKILITLSSSNSGNIPSTGPRTYPGGYRDPNEGSSWSIGYPEKFDITELCQEIGEKTNEEYTKIVAGLIDLIKFRRDYEGFLDESILNNRRLKRKLDSLLDHPMDDINSQLPIEKKFKKLNIDNKIVFYNDFIDMGFLVVRNSYIYKVVDESEFDSLCNEISYRLETLE